ncbi:MAG: cyclase family protein [Candidatus Poribacteria bacterium]|nr:cyclase family protein [Candidatus Poribacteria bacterium]
MGRIIDLSLTYERGMRGVDWETATTIDNQGWNARTLHLYSHAGTHMDAPRHFLPDGATIELTPLEKIVGEAWVVDCGMSSPRELLTVGHLGEVADRVVAGDRLLLKTGWSERFGTAAYRDELPRIGVELARWMVAKRVALVGVEPPSVADVNDLAEVTEIHRILLGGGVTIVEGLTNLDQLTRERVTFIALPLKIAEGDGCPCRAIAVEGDLSA